MRIEGWTGSNCPSEKRALYSALTGRRTVPWGIVLNLRKLMRSARKYRESCPSRFARAGGAEYGRPVGRCARLALWAGLLAGAGAAATPAAAEMFRYSLEIPDRQTAKYRIEIEPRHPGTLSV